MSLQMRVSDEFRRLYDQPPALLVRAPGRVNLIGEHTDYNDGFVLPMAIDRAAWLALRPRDDTLVRVYSVDFNHTAEFDLVSMTNTGSGWAEYIKGVAWALHDAGFTLCGWDGVVAGDVPIGSGLSSSAALELAAARAFSSLARLAWNPAEMARLTQRAENVWVGVNCGIMDQMISAAGKENHALLIDCRSLETTLVPLPSDSVVVVLDTNTRRGLVDSAYNERRAQCEAAARFFNVTALRDVSVSQFEAQSGGLDEVTRRRARHVVMENARTLQARDVMVNDDAAGLGRLMNASHASLRDDFEVSSPALNAIVACAVTQDGCYGARMTGAGFGGCAVALVKPAFVEDFVRSVGDMYLQQTGLTASVYVCRATNGAEIISTQE